MMLRLLLDVSKLVKDEYRRACIDKGPTHHSSHETCAILSEEVEEGVYESNMIVKNLDEFWQLVKSDATADAKKPLLARIQLSAEHAAAEFIQVAAMAQKAIATVEKEDFDNGNQNKQQS